MKPRAEGFINHRDARKTSEQDEQKQASSTAKIYPFGRVLTHLRPPVTRLVTSAKVAVFGKCRTDFYRSEITWMQK